jgi:hypothetical protein
LAKKTQISEVKLGTLESNDLAVKTMNKIGLQCKFHSLRMVYGESTSYSKGVLAIGGPDRG